MVPKKLAAFFTLQNATLALAAVVTMGWMWGTVGTLQKNFQLQQRLDELDQRVELAKLEAESMAYEQQYYKSQEYLEINARDKLGKAASGEKLILLPPAPEGAEPAPEIPAATTEQVGNFQQWMRFFFGTKS